jgi:hypothetical protein
VKEYDIMVPLYYNDGTPVELVKYQTLARDLLEHFEGATFFPTPSEGFRRNGEEIEQDKMVIFRVASSNSRKAKPFLKKLREKIKTDFRQDEILILQRDVELI